MLNLQLTEILKDLDKVTRLKVLILEIMEVSHFHFSQLFIALYIYIYKVIDFFNPSTAVRI